MKPDYVFENDVCIITYNDSIDFEYCQRHKIIDLDHIKKADLFILNLQYVSFIDSAGIGALVGVYRCLDSHGKSLCLINLQNNLKRVLEISEIEHLFPIFDSVTEARSHFLY